MARDGGREHDASERQLARWRDADVLPRGRRVGLGRGKGIRVEYPADYDAQLAAVLRLGTRAGGLAELRILLWFEGFAVPIRRVHGDMAQSIGRMASIMQEALPSAVNGGRAEVAAEADWLTDELLAQRPARRRRELYERAALRNLRPALSALFQMMVGQNPSFQDAATEADRRAGELSAAEGIEALTGVDSGRRAVFGEDPWNTGLPSDTVEDLAQSGALNLYTLAQTVAAASTEQLEQAREEVLALQAFAVIIRTMERVNGEPFGLSGFKALVHGDGDADAMTNGDAGVLTVWLAVVLHMRTVQPESTETFMHAIREGLAQIRAALPLGWNLRDAERAIGAHLTAAEQDATSLVAAPVR